MVYWLLASLVAALASLAAARFLTSGAWVDALFITGGAIGLSVALAVGLGLRRWLTRRWMPVAALVVAAAAAVGRATLLAHLLLSPAAATQLHFPSMALAASTLIWGGLGLLWGSLAVSDCFDPESRCRGWGYRLCAMAAVALALYSLAPLWHVLGMKVNHWTVLGLFGLACVAYGIGRVYRKLLTTIQPRS